MRQGGAGMGVLHFCWRLGGGGAEMRRLLFVGSNRTGPEPGVSGPLARAAALVLDHVRLKRFSGRVPWFWLTHPVLWELSFIDCSFILPEGFPTPFNWGKRDWRIHGVCTGRFSGSVWVRSSQKN